MRSEKPGVGARPWLLLTGPLERQLSDSTDDPGSSGAARTRAARQLTWLRWSQALMLSRPGDRQTAALSHGRRRGGGALGGAEQGWVGCWAPRLCAASPDALTRGRERKGVRGPGGRVAPGSWHLRSLTPSRSQAPRVFTGGPWCPHCCRARDSTAERPGRRLHFSGEGAANSLASALRGQG